MARPLRRGRDVKAGPLKKKELWLKAFEDQTKNKKVSMAIRLEGVGVRT